MTKLVTKLATMLPDLRPMHTAELQTIIRSLQEFRTDLLHVEAKRAEAELPRRIWETLSAFSNTPGGGVLILGSCILLGVFSHHLLHYWGTLVLLGTGWNFLYVGATILL